jgi:hypothetical protein
VFICCCIWQYPSQCLRIVVCGTFNYFLLLYFERKIMSCAWNSVSFSPSNRNMELPQWVSSI